MAATMGNELRRAVDTGKVVFGSKEVEKSLLKDSGKGVIVSSTLQKLEKEKLKKIAALADIPFFEFEGTALELGAVCGKPFRISAAMVSDQGKSKVLSLLKA